MSDCCSRLLRTRMANRRTCISNIYPLLTQIHTNMQNPVCACLHGEWRPYQCLNNVAIKSGKFKNLILHGCMQQCTLYCFSVPESCIDIFHIAALQVKRSIITPFASGLEHQGNFFCLFVRENNSCIQFIHLFKTAIAEMYEEDISRNWSDDEYETERANRQKAGMKIYDLNFDCLEYILDRLDLVDLTKFSSSNKRLCAVGNTKFAMRYGKKIIRFQCSWSGTASPAYSIDAKYITIFDFNLCTSICNIFGKSITRASINYTTFSGNLRNWRRVVEAVLRECHKTLRSIEFINCPQGIMDEICYPLDAAEWVEMRSCSLSARLSDMSIWFPNVRTLRLLQNKTLQPNALVKRFSSLNKLIVAFGRCLSLFSSSHLEGLLRLNGQIHQLKIDIVQDLRFVQMIRDILPDLQLLSIDSIVVPFSYYTGDGIHFDNVTKCKFPFTFSIIEEDSIVPVTFERLEVLKVILNCAKLTDPIIDAIVANKSIGSLEMAAVSYGFDIKKKEMSKILSALPLLKHLKIAQQFIQYDGMLAHILESETLITFTIRSAGNVGAALNEFHGWKAIAKESGDIVYNRIDQSMV